MTKPIIVVKICYKLLYVIQVVKKILISNFLASSFWSHLFAMLLLIGLALFTPKVFLFSIIFIDRPMVFMLIYVDKQSTSRDLYSCSWLIQWQHFRLVGLKLALDLLYASVDTVWQLLIKCNQCRSIYNEF